MNWKEQNMTNSFHRSPNKYEGKTLFFAFTVILLFSINLPGKAQITLHTDDLPRFYQAFDSVMTTTDTAQQAAFIQKLYVDKASKGLKEFMVLRGGTPPNGEPLLEITRPPW